MQSEAKALAERYKVEAENVKFQLDEEKLQRLKAKEAYELQI